MADMRVEWDMYQTLLSRLNLSGCYEDSQPTKLGYVITLKDRGNDMRIAAIVVDKERNFLRLLYPQPILN